MSGGLLLSSAIALTTQVLTFEIFFELKVLPDLEILNGNCGFGFTEVLLCVAPPLYKYPSNKPLA
jgi:hypothetical protein